MITLAVGDMRGWSAVSMVTSILSLALSYLLGKMYGMQWVMVAIALMDIPNVVFLLRCSLAGLNLHIKRLWHEAVKPSFFACFPLVGLSFYLKEINPIETLIGLVFAWVYIFYCGQ